MKYFLCKFEFISGLYESVFLKQFYAQSEKEALVQIVAFFTDSDEKDVENDLRKKLGKNWSIKKFWLKMDMDFLNSDESAGYQLMWVKEIKQDLDRDF
ncbi:hypothetical protein F9K33_00155 [bacterium]|nr:MAG: hypothetical protein F9K33_00155 [bacterium]